MCFRKSWNAYCIPLPTGMMRFLCKFRKIPRYILLFSGSLAGFMLFLFKTATCCCAFLRFSPLGSCSQCLVYIRNFPCPCWCNRLGFWGTVIRGSRCILLKSGRGNKKSKRPADRSLALDVAEREGFEPPEQLPVHRISSAARSTTPASFLHEFYAKLGYVFKIHKEKRGKNLLW